MNGKQINIKNEFDELISRVKELLDTYCHFDKKNKSMCKKWFEGLCFEKELQCFNKKMLKLEAQKRSE